MAESLLCLDPSSTACGVAFYPTLGCQQHPTYIHVIRPPERFKAIARIDYIVAGVIETVRRWKPSVVLLEYSAGKVAGRLQDRHISGLAVMGQAQGEIRRALICCRGDYGYEIETVDESWTGRMAKHERAVIAEAMFREYWEFRQSVGDPGYDAADAVMIGQWYMGQRQREGMVGRTV